MVYQVAPCGSRSDFLLVHVNLVCMYALSPSPPLHTSTFLYFILLLTLPHTHSSLFPPSPHTTLHSPLILTPDFPPSHSSHSSHTHSSHFLFPLLYPLPYLTPHSSHPHTNFLTLTPHTLHIDTENVFRLMVWVLDDRQKKQLHPLTPSHSQIEQSWSGYGQSFILQ